MGTQVMKVAVVAALILSSFSHAMAGDTKMTAQQADEMARTEAYEEIPGSSENDSPFFLTMYSFLYGPSLKDPMSGEVPTTYISGGDGVTVQNQIGVGYVLNDQMSIQPVLDFELVMTDPNALYRKDQYLSLSYDSFVRFNYSNIIGFDAGRNHFALHGDARYFVPTSEFSRDNHSPGSFRLTLTPTLEFGGTGFSIGVVSFARYFIQQQTFQSNNRTVALPELMLYTGPLLNYQVSDDLAVWLLGEASMTYDALGNLNTRDPDRSLVDVEPGVDFHLTKNVTISPYLNWFINRPISTTSVNVMASISI